MNKTLFGLSLISYNWENGKKDILDSYVPLACNILNSHTKENILREDLQLSFKNLYGIDIPLGAIESILKRMTKNSLLDRQNGEWQINHPEIAKIANNNKKEELNDTFQETIDDIKKYSFEEFQVCLEKEEIETGIISFFKEYDLDLLFANSSVDSILPKVRESKKIKYIIAKYISEVERENPKRFNSIIKLAKGYTIASLITYDEIRSFSGNLNNVDIFLDAPIIFNLIGLNGNSNSQLSEELIESLLKNGAKLKIFTVNYGEVVKTIEDAIKRLNSKDYDLSKSSRVLRTSLREGLNASQLQLKLNQLDELLKKYSVVKEESPLLDDKEYSFQIDEVKLTETIENLYKNGEKSRTPNYILDKIERDVEAISNIFKIRKNNRATSLKVSKALLLTSNEKIAYASKLYERSDWPYKSSIPTCVTDIFLSTILWANYPNRNDNLNIRQLMTECYNIIELDNRILNKFYEDVNKMKQDRLINDEQFYLLTASNLSFSLLEQKTLNDLEEYTDKTPSEILEDIKLSINSDLNRQTQKLSNIDGNIRKFAKLCGKFAFFLLALIIIVITIIIKSITVKISNDILNILTYTITILLAIFGILRWMEIIPTKTKIETFFEDSIYSFLIKILTKE
ncbi:hypothetical protein [Chryseobacterium gambrini]|uniref:hypothetical protein n=1 Tax=Chryseobacterium gambrini TaxID=373672 RepID=UPI003BA638A8